MSGAGTTHTATLNPGTYSAASGSDYESGIGKTTLTAICNDDNGFSIYAIGYTGNQYEGENHTKLVGANTNGTIVTKAYASGDTTSNWSMKLTKITDATESYNPQNLTITTNYDNWIAVPATFTKVTQYHANTGSSTTDTTLGVKLETTYAAYIASNQAADTYVGQVKYTMVHPYDEQPLQPQACPPGCICYFANGSNVEGTMGQQTVSTSATSATLLASNFSRTGYGFAGWSDKFDYAANAKFYGPQEDITFTAGQYTGSNSGLSLYAVWVKSAGSLQDGTKVSQLCGTGTGSLTTTPTDGTANLASVSALTDQRDNNTYAIAKLADGKCWMIENLRLESTNSDNSTGALAQGYGTSATYGNFSGLADAESANFTDSTTANSLYYSGTQSGDASIDIGTSTFPELRMPRYNNWNNQSTSVNRPQSPTTNDATNNTSNAGMYSYGNYYTWHAAIADTTYYEGIDHDTTSLCPTGWRLPTGSQSTATNSFGALSVALGGPEGGATADSSSTPTGAVMSKAFRSYPNNFLYSGYFNTSSAKNRGGYGYYWSSTAYNYNDIGASYFLSLLSSRVSPGTNRMTKYSGLSIRCTASVGT